MISLKELLGPYKLEDCTPEQSKNLHVLFIRLNDLRKDWGKPLKVTSGLRTHADMKRIYKSDVYPMKSKHLFGQAVDFADDGSLMAWLKEDDSARMKKYGLWGENGTVGWCHVQMVPMASYNLKTDLRWFNP